MSEPMRNRLIMSAWPAVQQVTNYFMATMTSTEEALFDNGLDFKGINIMRRANLTKREMAMMRRSKSPEETLKQILAARLP